MKHKQRVDWHAGLNTGHRAIDLQHYELFSKTNELIAMHEAGQSTQALDDLLPSLKTYALFHFSEEETMLARVAGGTESERQHVLQHREFAHDIEVWNQRRSSKTDTEIAEDLGHYLEIWLISHIAVADQELAHLVLAHETHDTPARQSAAWHQHRESFDVNRT
jgi:hemerythrin